MEPKKVVNLFDGKGRRVVKGLRLDVLLAKLRYDLAQLLDRDERQAALHALEEFLHLFSQEMPSGQALRWATTRAARAAVPAIREGKRALERGISGGLKAYVALKPMIRRGGSR
jgi:hypothetical protein